MSVRPIFILLFVVTFWAAIEASSVLKDNEKESQRLDGSIKEVRRAQCITKLKLLHELDGQITDFRQKEENLKRKEENLDHYFSTLYELSAMLQAKEKKLEAKGADPAPQLVLTNLSLNPL